MSARNRRLVPEATKGLNNFKLEVAEEIGLENYDKLDKGNLTSRQNGTVGGTMVKNMIRDYEEKLSK